MTERSITDRMGEALRIHRHGLVRPLWQDMTDEARVSWLAAASQMIDSMKRRGLKVVVQEGDKGDG